MYAAKKPSRALSAMFAMCMMATCQAEEIDFKNNPIHFNYIDLNFNLVPILIATIMAMLFGFWWMSHLALWARSTTLWRAATTEPEAEADPLQEDSRPAPRFVEIGVETDEHMGDLVPLHDYVMLTENIDQTHITREQHNREIGSLERDAVGCTSSRAEAHLLHSEWKMLACGLLLPSTPGIDKDPPARILHTLLQDTWHCDGTAGL